MTFRFIRTLFVLTSVIVGFHLGSTLRGYGDSWALLGALLGGCLAIIVIFFEKVLGKISLRGLSAAVFGLFFALIVSKLLSGAIDLIPSLESSTTASLKLALVLALSYLGMVFAMRGRDEFNLIIPYVKFDRKDQKDEILILDTSAIIDGRILDVCQSKFVEGRLVVPRFVLKELQQVADSQDSQKRTRGRRGLDVLNKLRNTPGIRVKINEEDFPNVSEVDAKLVKLGKLLDAKVLTTDYNLNKVAELQGVTILNVNELAAALRPVFLPGESLQIRLLKAGKEVNQAVGYLDDGTMVVTENGRDCIGELVPVVVTSVLQTSAGRMIFAKLQMEKVESH